MKDIRLGTLYAARNNITFSTDKHTQTATLNTKEMSAFDIQSLKVVYSLQVKENKLYK